MCGDAASQGQRDDRSGQFPPRSLRGIAPSSPIRRIPKHFDFLSSVTIRLEAPKDGPLAGILIFGDREADDLREYKITSDNARVLLGAIYIPRGFLTIDPNNPLSEDSPWTAIVASRITLKKSSNLVLRTDHGLTDVPVPNGFASSNIRLIQ